MKMSPFFPIPIAKTFSLGCMTLLVMSSAIAVVYTKHINRSLHIQLQQLQKTRDNLHIEWSKLLLEQGTLGSDLRVEKIASDELNMFVPKAEEMMVVRP